MLSEQQEGVVVQIDEDGDGNIERSVVADSDLTKDEFLAPIPQQIVVPACGAGLCGAGIASVFPYLFLGMIMTRIRHRKHYL